LNRKNVDFECDLAGSGPLEKELKNMVERYELRDHVRFLGRVDNQRLPDILCSADIFVSTSRSDGTNVSLLEAMACGAFPMVTRIEGNEQWIKDGENGCMVPLDDPEYLANKMGEVSQNFELRRKAARINRQIVESRADVIKNVKIYGREYKGLAGLK
jgi:glycosyltransferase involved in cell wall biosynthesis